MPTPAQVYKPSLAFFAQAVAVTADIYDCRAKQQPVQRFSVAEAIKGIPNEDMAPLSDGFVGGKHVSATNLWFHLPFFFVGPCCRRGPFTVMGLGSRSLGRFGIVRRAIDSSAKPGLLR